MAGFFTETGSKSFNRDSSRVREWGGQIFIALCYHIVNVYHFVFVFLSLLGGV